MIVAGSNTGVSAVYPSAREPSKLPRTWTVLVFSGETMKLIVDGERLVSSMFEVSVPSG